MLTVIGTHNLGSFLAINSPIGGEFLVVEGWLPTYAYREAVSEFRKGGYRKIISAGMIQVESDTGELVEFFGTGKLISLGIPNDLIVTASYSGMQQDRTFHSALAVKAWLQEQGLRSVSIDIVTVGPHARRSRLLYEIALGNEVKVGVIAVKNRGFDLDHWWRSSEGTRAVVGEAIAYLYARAFFSPPP